MNNFKKVSKMIEQQDHAFGTTERYHALLKEVPSIDEMKRAYIKLQQKILKLPKPQYYMLDDEGRREYAMAYAYDAMMGDLVSKDTTPNIKDLNNLLKAHPTSIIDGVKLKRNTNGLKFINHYVKEYIIGTKVEIGGSGRKTMTDAHQDHSFIYKSVIKMMKMNIDISRNNIYGFFKIASIQVPSNFKPLVASALWHKWGIEQLPKNQKELNIFCPSEGWTSRLLSSYKIAQNNPHIQVNYYTVDPNPQVKSAYELMVKFLSEYGGFNKIKNWHTHYYFGGSQDEDAIPSDVKGKIDIAGTSPPYFGTSEKYGYNVALHGLKPIDENIHVNVDGTDVHLGDLAIVLATTTTEKLKQGENEYQIVKTNDLKENYQNTEDLQYFWEASQSSNIDSYTGWKETFLRPTIENIYKNLRDGGYMWINIANVKTNQEMEADTVQISIDSGFEHHETMEMLISRSPALKDKNKLPYEPVFIFKKK